MDNNLNRLKVVLAEKNTSNETRFETQAVPQATLSK